MATSCRESSSTVACKPATALQQCPSPALERHADAEDLATALARHAGLLQSSTHDRVEEALETLHPARSRGGPSHQCCWLAWARLRRQVLDRRQWISSLRSAQKALRVGPNLPNGQGGLGTLAWPSANGWQSGGVCGPLAHPPVRWALVHYLGQSVFCRGCQES